jgi:hypothetical protein
MTHTDFTIKPNTQSQRENYTELWDVVVGSSVNIITCKGQIAAQKMADQLNIDPYYLERGQTEIDRATNVPYMLTRDA